MTSEKSKLKRWILAVFTVVTVASSGAEASQYATLYSFGDSLSDAGNLFASTGQPPPPYSMGRFSNGPVWVQDLSVMLGAGVLAPSLLGGNDYAFGGAQTGPTAVGGKSLIDLPAQIAAFGLVHPTASSSALYTLSIGSNDIFQTLDAIALGTMNLAQAEGVIGQAAQNTANAAAGLLLLGATNLALFDVPNLGLTPAYNSTPLASTATALAAFFNQSVLADLVPVEVSGLKVYDLNAFALLGSVVNDPSAFGFTNAHDACFTGTTLCGTTTAEQNQYLFWDDVHPTAAGHLEIAQAAFDQVTAVPEPSSWALLLLGFGALGFAGYRRSQKGHVVPTTV